MATVTGWSAGERHALDEARGKLRRRARLNAFVGVLGLLGTIASFAVLPSGGILFWGAIVVGPFLAISATQKVRRLDALQPGTPLNAQVLGIRTALDPPRTNNRTAVIVLGVAIALLLGFVVVGLAFG
jgi:hypothetical protein